MPITKSAKKALKQSLRKYAMNKHFKDLYTESRRAFEKAIKDKNVDLARSVLRNTKDASGKKIKAGLQSVIDKLAKKGIIHANNASRKKAKYAWMLKKLDLELNAA